MCVKGTVPMALERRLLSKLIEDLGDISGYSAWARVPIRVLLPESCDIAQDSCARSARPSDCCCHHDRITVVLMGAHQREDTAVSLNSHIYFPTRRERNTV